MLAVDFFPGTQASITLAFTAEVSGLAIMSLIAEPPKVAIQSTQTSDGMISTQTTNSRTVRPRLTRAMNIPTKGDHEIHQAR